MIIFSFVVLFCPKFSFLDASGFIYRAYHAFPKIVNSKGQALGALLGFVTMMLKYNDNHQKSHWACVFDSPGKKGYWRTNVFPDYKKHRPSMPQELWCQFPLIYEACRLLNLPIVQEDGHEADDLIASLCEKVAKIHGENHCITIGSSDKDLNQLVSEHCCQFDPLKQKKLFLQDVHEKWGVDPWQIPHVQCLAGDASDGIPGIPNVGPKTATQWIQKYGTHQEVIEHWHQLDKRRGQLLWDHQDQGRLCYTLALLRRDVPVPPLDTLLWTSPQWQNLGDFLWNLEFHKLARQCFEKAKNQCVLF